MDIDYTISHWTAQKTQPTYESHTARFCMIYSICDFPCIFDSFDPACEICEIYFINFQRPEK